MKKYTYLTSSNSLSYLTISILGSLAFSPSQAADLPVNGTVKFGSGTITQPSNQQMQINQNSDKLAVDWQSFNIAEGNKVNFQQPSSSAIALNRVVGTEGSKVMGQLNANGRVFLVNPNGVLFGNNAQVNVGGLVASTQDLSTANFAVGKYNFNGGNSPASVVNQGTITAADGGTVVLLGGQVSNQGNIQANLGSVKLASGKATTLDFAGDGLVNIQVTGAAANALAENSGFIQADGGQVVMSAAYANNSVLQTVVNNTGTIQAQTLSNKAGKIVLSGGQQGLVNVDGLLDASAAELGNGGSVETSGRTVNVSNSTTVDTRGMGGKTGTWNVTADKVEVNDSASSNKVSARAVSNNLRTSNIELFSNSSDLTIGNDISWTSANQLLLVAQDNLVLNANLKATGKNASLAFIEGGDYVLAKGKSVTLSGQGASFSNNGQNYAVIQNLSQLQAMENNLAGYYVLGNTIDASSTAQDVQFRPVGYSDDHAFTGILSGLGHTINQLVIKQQDAVYTQDPYASSLLNAYIGLFGYSKGVLRNVGLVNANLSTGGMTPNIVNGKVHYNYVGGLAGQQSGGSVHDVYAENVNIRRTANYGTEDYALGGLIGQVVGTDINNVYATGNVAGERGSSIGGLIGYATDSTITDSYATGNVTGWSNVGGLVGRTNNSTITDSYATGNVAGSWGVGGLVGYAFNSTITGAYAIGNVVGSWSLGTGGLVGDAYNATIIDSYAAGDVDVIEEGRSAVGGLVGWANSSTITNSYATGNVAGFWGAAGGLVGEVYSSAIINSYATGNIVGSATIDSGGVASPVGGLLGQTYNTTITNSYATGDVTVEGLSSAGGLVGNDYNSAITDSHATGNVNVTGNVTGEWSTATGGLVGSTQGTTITHSFATGDVIVEGYSSAGGLVGYDVYKSTITDSHSTGNVYMTGNVTGTWSHGAGGLIGRANYSTIISSYAVGNVTVWREIAGELVGYYDNSSSIIDSYGYGTVYHY